MKITAEQLAERLTAALGANALSVEPDQLAAHRVAGKLPALVCLPHSADQVAAALAICAEARACVIPYGSGSAMAIGNPPLRVDVVLSTSRLNRLIEHDQANLTVTVESGIALGALQTALAAQKQFVPFDPPSPERSTVGGVIAANLNGPRRCSLGSVRDLVIGMKVVLGSGEQIKAGGKVVKNVAGYDMCKLFTGSLGTLGIITAATLRLAPVPEESATGVMRGSLAHLLKLAREVGDARLLPAALFLGNETAARGWRMAVRCTGFSATVARQISDLDSLARQNGLELETLRANQEAQTWRAIDDLPLEADRTIYRVTVPPSSLGPVLAALQTALVGAVAPVIGADVAIGTIWIVMPATQANTNQFTKFISLAQEHCGHAVMYAAPSEVKTGIEVWGPSPPTISLMRKLKQRFDPHGILNPGRFVGGL